MKNFLKVNCCDGIYKSYDVHFTSACDNKCAHCIDNKYDGLNIQKPDVDAIANSIITNSEGFDDVLFLGGEPCLYLEELVRCIEMIKEKTNLLCYVTTSVPKICFDKQDVFYHLIDICDGINISAQHYDECIADKIRNVKSKFDRQAFYASLPHKEKFRININVVKPYLCTKEQICECLKHYDDMGFPEIKLSEIQQGEEYYVKFEDLFGIKLGSAYSHGCQTIVDMKPWIPSFKGKLILKRSCFLCEESLDASFLDLIKTAIIRFFPRKPQKYGVVYENGTITNGWV